MRPGCAALLRAWCRCCITALSCAIACCAALLRSLCRCCIEALSKCYQSAIGADAALSLRAGDGHAARYQARLVTCTICALQDMSLLYLWAASIAQRSQPRQVSGAALTTHLAQTLNKLKSTQTPAQTPAAARKLHTWGYGEFGVLGHSTHLPQHYPREVEKSVMDAHTVSAGGTHTLALDINGYVFACGRDTNNGCLGISGPPVDQFGLLMAFAPVRLSHGVLVYVSGCAGLGAARNHPALFAPRACEIPRSTCA